MRYRWKHGAPRCAFVTGAASGLGLIVARTLIAEGSSVALFDLRFSQELRGDLQAAGKPGQKVEFYEFDISDRGAVHTAVDVAAAAVGPPDLALNAAGILLAAPYGQIDDDGFRKVIEVNLLGTHYFASAVLNHMQRGGHLALIASMAGKIGNYAYGAYCASKFGVTGIAEVLRVEMIERGIDVTAICPAEIETPMVLTERETMHPVTRELKAFPGVLQPEPAAEMMLRGIAARKPVVVMGLRPKLTLVMASLFPGAARWVTRQLVTGALRKMKRSGAG
ncbi:SDR family NAD(P)-dependent oxidoreductase [Ruegeria sp. 2012CJ41-6]|uniref:SDR family NAD(P)-dependent oxidoreductase n=1 Tax=Ruegeria spongiae TaxID=2942209 RepID=A0ABT0Q7P5_9RHOB|nr:SDR family NAD(P)-dependent oxidoreductase [Ruegeria spongiae]MCL6284884.1 SDR family NAD(P)-dependent oxidoreductase [Ruegeria spongiae]